MDRNSQLQHKVEETEAWRLGSQCRVPWFPLQSSHSFHYSNCLTLKCLLRSFWERGFWILKNIITFTNDLVIVFIASQWSVKCSKRQHRTISFDGDGFPKTYHLTLLGSWCPDFGVWSDIELMLSCRTGNFEKARDWEEGWVCPVFILKHWSCLSLSKMAT